MGATRGADAASVVVPPLPVQRSLADIRAELKSTNTWITTPDGLFVHYKLENAEALAAGKRLLLVVHGFAIAGVQHYGPLAKAIASRGVPVLIVDLFGRGLSDRLAPPARYNGELYSDQLRDTLAGLASEGVGYTGGAVDVLGFSMGGM